MKKKLFANISRIEILFLLIPVLWLGFLQVINNKVSITTLFGLAAFYLVILLLALQIRRFQEAAKKRIDWPIIMVFCLLIIALGLSFTLHDPVYSWFFVGTWIIFNFIGKPYLCFTSRKFLYVIQLAVWASVIGAFLILIDQIQTNFSEEEFFVAIQALEFVIFIFLFVLVFARAERKYIHKQKDYSQKTKILVTILYSGVIICFIFFTLTRYQKSFYPESAILYPGITQDQPFLCGTVEDSPSSDQERSSKEIFETVIEKIIENPLKKTPEFGFLSLVTLDPIWPTLFHDHLLDEAEKRYYTQPANSVKYGQLEAAIRIYYYSKVIEKYPDIFTPVETAQLKDWFADINRRAMTVEWVDWMYGAAFSMWPEGPYENQEIGAGLLSMLLVNDLSAPELKEKNIDYLERNQRGWLQRFRNTDDAFIYQSTWITSAYFQSLYFGDAGMEENMRKSFEWIMLQILPSGSSPLYNFPSDSTDPSALLFGAYLFNDSEYLWVAGRALDSMKETGIALFAYPGIEKFGGLQLNASMPKVGTCLLYSDTGLPNQIGSIAPDKVVFRSGWNNTDKYLLINLRSSGWHKYKGTNTVTTIFHNDQLISERNDQPAISWLPEGRSKLRDKRIPRETLNGLFVSRYGLNSVLCNITACESDWSQNPPSSVIIEGFVFYDNIDYMNLSIAWAGLKHNREIYFYHNGPIFVLDSVQGIGKSAISWNANGNVDLEGQTAMINNSLANSLIYFLADDKAKISLLDHPRNESSQLLFSKSGDKLQLLTSIVEGDNLQSVQFEDQANQYVVVITQNQQDLTYYLPKP